MDKRLQEIKAPPPPEDEAPSSWYGPEDETEALEKEIADADSKTDS